MATADKAKVLELIAQAEQAIRQARDIAAENHLAIDESEFNDLKALLPNKNDYWDESAAHWDY